MFLTLRDLEISAGLGAVDSVLFMRPTSTNLVAV